MRRRYMRVNSFTQFDVNDYLTIEALDDNLSIVFVQDIEFGIDGIGWKKLAANTPSPVIEKGQTISLRAKCIPLSGSSIGTFSINKPCNLLGNIMSLLSSDNLDGVSFGSLFKDCNTIRDASNLKLPATTLSQYCYQYMFYGCNSLTKAPELPATTLTTSCYYAMFYDCTSLVNAPELPATTLSQYCYKYMFRGCTSLVNAPALPATTLYYACYQYMFYGCNSLTKAPELPATTLSQYCYSYMFYGCEKLNYIKARFTTTPSSSYTSNWVNGVASSGTFVKNKNATWDVTGANGIPGGWTIKKE